MSHEDRMRRAMQEYIDAFNRVDLDGIVDLYAQDATVEDPVGSELKVGKDDIRAFYEYALTMGAQLKLSAPIRTSHSNSAAMAFEVKLTMPEGPAVIHVIDVMTFNEAGEFTTMKAYWGPSDMVPGGA